MSEIPQHLKYSRDHEWIRAEDDGSVVVGITDHAQEALGELVYVELPEAGQTFAQGDACSVVESVKAASDVYAPVSGEITGTNQVLTDEPELVNTSPYEGGWIIRLQPSSAAELDELLTADAYTQFLAESAD